MPGRTARWPLPAASLLLVVLVAWYYLIGTPQYSVYRLTGALHDRDATGAERFIDVNRVAQSASDVIVVDYLTREPRAAKALEALGQGGARATAARALEPLVASRVRAEIKKMADRGGSGRSPRSRATAQTFGSRTPTTAEARPDSGRASNPTAPG